MCVIYFSYKSHVKYPLILIANRDEYYDRPTLAADNWEDCPDIYGGRDLVAGGTWLGVTGNGRFAAVTNYRKAGDARGSNSRGALVAGFLSSDISPSQYLEQISTHADDFSGFNLLVGEVNRENNNLFYYSNRNGLPRQLYSGIYGLSNHLLDTPWPKLVRGKEKFRKLLSENRVNEGKLFELMRDSAFASDEELPDTGIGIEKERFLSPIFIETPVYGTRCSTLLTIDNEFKTVLKERVYR